MEQARRQNMPLPDKIKNKPILLPGLEFYYTAFLELTTCRPVGMGEGPIPWSAIQQYAFAHEVRNMDELERMTALVRRMDMVYLEHRNKKLNDKKEALKTKQKAPHGQKNRGT